MNIKQFYKAYFRKDSIEYFVRKGGKIGKNCVAHRGVVWGSEPYLISFGDNCRITHGVKFVTHDGGIWVLRHKGIFQDGDLFGKIIIGNNVHIGWDSIIMPGVHIGNNVIIGAGAVVTKDIPNNSVAAGVPARVIETIDEYQVKIKSRVLNTKHMNAKEKRDYLSKIDNNLL